jgi:hypothetical protein
MSKLQGRSLQPSKEEHPELQNMNFFTFSYWEKPSALKREHPELQNMNFFTFSYFCG